MSAADECDWEEYPPEPRWLVAGVSVAGFELQWQALRMQTYLDYRGDTLQRVR